MGRKSLQSKFVFSISLITLISLVITSVIMFFITIGLFWESKEDSLEDSTQLGRAEISSWFTDKEVLLTTVAEDMRMFEFGDKEAVEDYLSHYAAKYNYLVDIFIGLPNKDMYSGTYWQPDAGYDARTRSWYIDAKNAGGLVYTEPYIDAMSGVMVITISVPCSDKTGRDMGVMGMDIKLDSLVEMINGKTISGTTARGFLLDGNRQFIAHENPDYLPWIETDTEVEHYTKFDETGIVLGKNVAQGSTSLYKNSWGHDGARRYISMAAIPQNGWTYGFSVPVSDFNNVYFRLILQWVGISLALMAVAALMAVYISRRLLAPIKAIIAAAGRLSLGDVHVDVKMDSDDELGELSGKFRQMIASTAEQIDAMQQMASGNFTARIRPKSTEDELSIAMNAVMMRLSGLIREIDRSAGQVSEGSSQMADAAQSLALGSTEQAASVEQLSASLATVLESAQRNADSAGEANRSIELVRSKAGDGTAAMDGMVKAVEAISSSSADIEKIIKVIEDIAFQTNILALNAAVEAARAGIHGKGFAVVADEVRNLATKSAEAARQTTSLIGDSTAKAADGMDIARRTNEILADIAQQIVGTAALMERIAETSSRQVNEIGQINIGVEQVSQVVQQNSATAEESAAASEEISAQAAALEGMMSTFKIDGE